MQHGGGGEFESTTDDWLLACSALTTTRTRHATLSVSGELYAGGEALGEQNGRCLRLGYIVSGLYLALAVCCCVIAVRSVVCCGWWGTQRDSEGVRGTRHRSEQVAPAIRGQFCGATTTPDCPTGMPFRDHSNCHQCSRN
jgi:hypothetical protein